MQFRLSGRQSVDRKSCPVRSRLIADIDKIVNLAAMQTWKPKVLGKWLALGFAVGTLCFGLSNADALDVVVLNIVLLPWIVGPVLMAAFFVRRASTSGTAWSLLMVEVGAAGSMIALWTYLIVHSDAQNGIAMLLFPVVQFPAVIVMTLLVIALQELVKRIRSSP
jgi:hypothetical protein